jgi:hypothetical protein
MHLLLDISPHGYGHLAQAAPVVNALRESLPALRLTVRSTLPQAVLASHLAGGFRRVERNGDLVPVMHDAVTVDIEATGRAYAALHAGWPARVAEDAAAIRALQPDLVLSAMGCLSLAAAATAGVPAAALGSFHWAEIYSRYCGRLPGADAIHDQMLDAYGSAGVFLKLTPGMPMPELDGPVIGPVARLGRERRAELRQRLDLANDASVVLVALGGIPTQLAIERWPARDDLRWLVPADWNARRTDATAFEALGWPFGDLVASADAVVTKPGYGTFVEAACAGIAVLTLDRPDWPEAPYLMAWLDAHARARVVRPDELESATVADLLDALWSAPAPPRPAPSGNADGAEILEALLTLRNPDIR